MQLELSNEDAAALIKELHAIVERDRYPLSPRVQTLRATLHVHDHMMAYRK